tara:strand:+ start:183 stop:386 length:204 start_codon:yes stop_codon:yes gene_type:complete
MTDKPFTEKGIDTKNPLIHKNKSSNKVDINILRSKIQKAENLELKKNILVISFLIIGLLSLGIYLSI